MSALTPDQLRDLGAAHVAAIQGERTAFTATQQAFARAHHALDDANWPTPEERSPEVVAAIQAKTQARADYIGALNHRNLLSELAVQEGLL